MVKDVHYLSPGGQLFDKSIEIHVLNIQEASAFLKISPKVLYRLVKDGQIPHRKIGKQTRFLVIELVEWMKGA